jgi:NAD(P)-dependent dehydrogenase (short-subunit alcohol dehydrogenase family)
LSYFHTEIRAPSSRYGGGRISRYQIFQTAEQQQNRHVGVACSRYTGAWNALLDNDVGQGSEETMRDPQLAGRTVVVIGGSSGIGLETARHARDEGATVILTGRDSTRLSHAAHDVGAASTSAFDVTDEDALSDFFDALPTIDHVMVTAGSPRYAPLLEMDRAEVLETVGASVSTYLAVARCAKPRMSPQGSLTLLGGTGGRHIGRGIGINAVTTAELPPLTATLALELAPMRVNLIAAGFVDTPLSATLLGDQLEERRADLRARLPIRRVVQAADVAALAIHLMTNTALTGATFDIDGGQQFIAP